MSRWARSRLAAVGLALAAGLCGGFAGSAVTRHAAAGEQAQVQPVTPTTPAGTPILSGHIVGVAPTGCTLMTVDGQTVQVLVTDTTQYYVHPSRSPSTVANVELRGAFVDVSGRFVRPTDIVATSITLFPHFHQLRPGSDGYNAAA